MTTTAGRPNFSNLVPQPVAGVGPVSSIAGGSGRDGSRAIDRNNFPACRRVESKQEPEHPAESEQMKAPMTMTEQDELQSKIAAAVVAGEVFTAHARATFALMAGAKDELARRALEWIRRHRLQRFTIAEAFESLRNGMGAGAVRDDLLRPLDILESRRYVRRSTAEPARPKGGRPETARFEVNPATHEVTP